MHLPAHVCSPPHPLPPSPLQARGVYSDGEDQTGAAGQLYLVWQEEETIQRQVPGQAQRG